jgi:hypothetical protein
LLGFTVSGDLGVKQRVLVSRIDVRLIFLNDAWKNLFFLQKIGFFSSFFILNFVFKSDWLKIKRTSILLPETRRLTPRSPKTVNPNKSYSNFEIPHLLCKKLPKECVLKRKSEYIETKNTANLFSILKYIFLEKNSASKYLFYAKSNVFPDTSILVKLIAWH